MSYLKNAFILFALSYYHSILDTNSKELLKKLVDLKLKKYSNQLSNLTDLIDSQLDVNKPIQKDAIDFDNQFKITTKSIKDIDTFEIEKDLEDIIKTLTVKNKKTKRK